MQITRAEISLSALQHNYNAIQRHIGPGRKILAVIKTNAYGHGMIEVSKALLASGAEHLAVGSVEEGIILRQQNITLPILVLGVILEDQVGAMLAHDLSFTVASYGFALAVERAAARRNGPKPKVHLKVDTGMGRIGVTVKEAPEFVEKVSRLAHLEVAGLFSHFATAGEKDKTYARGQLEAFNGVLESVRAKGIRIPLIHMANTSAVLDLPDAYFTMVRPGIGLYGIYPTEEVSRPIELKPVLSLKSRILFLKEVPPGTSISYGRRYRTRERTTIATVPVGYADGYSRRLSGITEVLVKGRRYPVVGSICMDHFMVDLGPDAPVDIGDDVILLGSDGTETIGVWDLALKLGVIPYEVLTGISARVPRVMLH